MLHLLFISNVAYRNNLNIGIPCDSNLDELFELDKYKMPYPADISCLYDEIYGGSPSEYIEKEKINFRNLNSILNAEIDFPNNFYLKGWFWHYDLMPIDIFFDHFKIKENLKEYVRDRYTEYLNKDTVTVHYRGSDFINHSVGWGDLRLPFSYYRDSLNYFINEKNITKILLVSDEPNMIENRIKEEFPNIEIKTTNENYLIDWIILKESKNLVCSNSSYCWTAGLFNKDMTIQPKGFLLRNISNSEDNVFPPNIYYKKNNLIL